MLDSFTSDIQSGWSKGYVPYPLDAFEKGIEKCLRRGYVSSGTIFLDLGAGKGRLVIKAARHGFHAYGIEYHEQYVSAFEENISLAHLSAALKQDTICRVVQGSYYPKEYVALRDRGEAIALSYEDKFSPTSFPLEKRKCVFHPVASDPNPFTVLGIALQEVLVFFSYTWGVELPSQLELFSRYAHPQAIFLNETAQEPEQKHELLDALGLQQEKIILSASFHNLMLYRKK